MNPANPADVRGQGGPLFTYDVAPGLADGQWHFYTLTSAADKGGTVYVDGKVKGTSASYKGNMLNLTDPICLGRRGYVGEATRYLGGPAPDDGMIDDVGLWSEALIPGAIGRLYTYGILPPAHILVVSDALDMNADGVQDDQGLVDWLKTEGHSVDFRPDYWNILDPNKSAALEAADLIVISRSATAAAYAGDLGEVTLWNAVTTPILNLHAYLAGNDGWKWINAGTATGTAGAPRMQGVDPNHPVFAGVTLSARDPNDPNSPRDVVSVVDASVGAGLTSFLAGLDVGQGKLLAQTITGNSAWIAEWQPGVEFYAGSGQIAGGWRLLFCAGTTAQGVFNLTAEGQEMLRNAIAHLLVAPVAPLPQSSGR